MGTNQFCIGNQECVCVRVKSWHRKICFSETGSSPSPFLCCVKNLAQPSTNEHFIVSVSTSCQATPYISAFVFCPKPKKELIDGISSKFSPDDNNRSHQLSCTKRGLYSTSKNKKDFSPPFSQQLQWQNIDKVDMSWTLFLNIFVKQSLNNVSICMKLC